VRFVFAKTVQMLPQQVLVIVQRAQAFW